jgi:hypothetical protein
MRTSRRIACALSLALASLLFFSCNNSYGIFYSIQQERKQVGTKVFQKTTVNNAFRLGAYYYATTATLNRRTIDDGSWSSVDIGGFSSYTLRSAVLAGSTIYALIETGKADPPTLSVYGSTDGSTWPTLISLPTCPSGLASDNDSFSLDALYATSNGELYAEGHKYTETSSTYGYSNYYLFRYNGSSFVQVVGASSAFSPAIGMTLRGVVFDSANNKYWFASEDKLFSGTQADGSDAVNSVSAFSGLSLTADATEATTLWDISYAGSGTTRALYVSNKAGTLFRYQSGTSSSQDVASVPITKVIEVPAASGATMLLAGTDAINTTSAVGYYEGTFPALVIGSKTAIVALNSSIYSTTVSSFPVHAFYYDSTYTETGTNYAGIVFICVSPGTSSTKYYGLYSSKWDPSSQTWSGWSAE